MVRRRRKAVWARHPLALLMAVHHLRPPYVAETIPKDQGQNLPRINSLHISSMSVDTSTAPDVSGKAV